FQVGRGINRRFLLGERGSRVVVAPERVVAPGDCRSGKLMTLSDVVMRVVGFLRAGYPEDIPTRDYVPLLALLRRRLSDDDVIAVAAQVISRHDRPVDVTDVRVAITKLTDEMPSPEDTERVKQRLAAVGWPVDDAADR